MRYGFWLPVFGGWLRNVDDEPEATWEYASTLARRAEQIGYDLTLIAELNLNDIKGIEAPSLDAWTTAAALAAVTERLELMVAVRPTFHNPALLAKQAANIDRIADGRLSLNVVSSWWRDEATKYGIPFDEHEERYARTAEWLEVIDGCWREQGFTHRGKLYDVGDNVLSPKPDTGAALHGRATRRGNPARTPDPLRRRRIRNRQKPDRPELRRLPDAWGPTRNRRPQDRRHARAPRGSGACTADVRGLGLRGRARHGRRSRERSRTHHRREADGARLCQLPAVDFRLKA